MLTELRDRACKCLNCATSKVFVTSPGNLDKIRRNRVQQAEQRAAIEHVDNMDTTDEVREIVRTADPAMILSLPVAGFTRPLASGAASVRNARVRPVRSDARRRARQRRACQ